VEGNKPQATPCCCGKYTFPTFEVETLDWSWSPITDDDGVHEWDRCLSGLRDDAMDDVVRPSDVVEKCRCQDRPSGSDAPIRHDTSPLAEFLDIDQDGEGMCRVSIDPVHLSPNGTMHGGALFTMFDTAMGTAAAGHLAEGQMCVTMEIQIRYLKPIFEGEVEVHGTVLHPGRRIIQTEARATSGGRLVASATGSFVVLDSDIALSRQQAEDLLEIFAEFRSQHLREAGWDYPMFDYQRRMLTNLNKIETQVYQSMQGVSDG
jgi:uncharacterized protein (TIGR00369 family)